MTYGYGSRKPRRNGQDEPDGEVRLHKERPSRSNAAALKAMFEAPEQEEQASVLDNFAEEHEPLGMLDMLSAAEDRTTMEEVIGGPNADRAAGTYEDIMGLEAAEDLDPMVLESLISGVSTPMTDNEFGQRGVIGRQQAGVAAKTFMDLDDKDKDKIMRLLGKDEALDEGQGSDPTQRALILKALAARSKDIGKGGEDKAKAMSELAGFAFETGGMEREELVRKTTPFDLEGGEEGQGLTQRYMDSCGPSVFQMLLADADPVAALNFHQDDLSGLGRKGPVGKQQKEFLDAVGKPYKRREKKGLKRFFEKGEGIANSNLKGATQTMVAPKLGIDDAAYMLNPMGSEADRKKGTDKLDPALQHGVSAPIGIDYDGGGGHFMAISDVRSKDGKKQYLVHDPWTGRSLWKDQDDMAAGETDFGVGQGTLTETTLDGTRAPGGKAQFPE